MPLNKSPTMEQVLSPTEAFCSCLKSVLAIDFSVRFTFTSDDERYAPGASPGPVWTRSHRRESLHHSDAKDFESVSQQLWHASFVPSTICSWKRLQDESVLGAHDGMHINGNSMKFAHDSYSSKKENLCYVTASAITPNLSSSTQAKRLAIHNCLIDTANSHQIQGILLNTLPYRYSWKKVYMTCFHPNFIACMYRHRQFCGPL